MKNKKVIRTVWEWFMITFGTLIVAAAVYFFLMPSHFAVGSISGLAVILQMVIPIPVSVISLVLNILLLILGFILVGREFSGKTVYTSILLPVFIGIFEKLLPDFQPMTDSPLLELICYVFTVSLGMAILFNRNASSGGLDIVAKIMNRYLHMELGKAMSLAGMCVAFSAVFVSDAEILILSILGTYLNGVVVDHFIFGSNLKKRVCIIADNEEEIKRFILDELHCGATLYESTGAYEGTKRHEIITIVDQSKYGKLMNYLSRAETKAFVTVYEVNSMTYCTGCTKK